MTPRSMAAAAALLTSSFGLLACSGSASISIGGESPTDAASGLIEGEISEAAGIEFSDVECESPDSTDVGTTFDCTAQSDEGTARFVAEIDREDHLDVNSTNIIRGDALDGFEASAAEELSASVGAELPAENFDCGSETIVLPESAEIACLLEDPNSGSVFDATLTITDLDSGAFDIEVADTPN